MWQWSIYCKKLDLTEDGCWGRTFSSVVSINKPGLVFQVPPGYTSRCSWTKPWKPVEALCHSCFTKRISEVCHCYITSQQVKCMKWSVKIKKLTVKMMTVATFSLLHEKRLNFSWIMDDYRVWVGAVLRTHSCHDTLPFAQNKGDYWGPQKKSCCCQTGSKMLLKHLWKVWTPPNHSILYKRREGKLLVALLRSGRATNITPVVRRVPGANLWAPEGFSFSGWC